MTLHVFDVKLVQEWFATCGEYCGFVMRPFGKMGFKAIWSLNQSNLEDWLQTWSVLQFWWAVIVNIAALLILIIMGGGDYIASAIQNCMISALMAYVYAHVGWFGILKKNGCCCFCIVCLSDMPILNLILGVWLIVWGGLMVVNSLAYLSAFDLGFLYTIIYASYVIPLVYMGIACIKLWQKNKGSDGGVGSGVSNTVVGQQTA